MALATATSGSVWWFTTRGTGVVALVLLTVAMVLGLTNAARLRTRSLPRFVLDSVHRNSALLAVAFLALHVVTAVFDGYVPLSFLDAVVPFNSAYQPFWVGLGAISLDLGLAVLVTSLLRRHLGYRAWKATHWLAYGSWPIAFAHSLGMGSDAGSAWMLAGSAVCVAGVVAAGAVRWADNRAQPADVVTRAPRRMRVATPEGSR